MLRTGGDTTRELLDGGTEVLVKRWDSDLLDDVECDHAARISQLHSCRCGLVSAARDAHPSVCVRLVMRLLCE